MVFDARIASGGGRQNITMDRYDANWAMVAGGWKTHVLGEGRSSPAPAMPSGPARAESWHHRSGSSPLRRRRNGNPSGTVGDGDAVVFFNFRGDRAIEITRAFVEETAFDKFDRCAPRSPTPACSSTTATSSCRKRFLVASRHQGHLGEWFTGKNGQRRQFACSETQKFGHVTYFWNGNRSGKFDGETIRKSPATWWPFEQQPWMKAAEIADDDCRPPRRPGTRPCAAISPTATWWATPAISRLPAWP